MADLIDQLRFSTHIYGVSSKNGFLMGSENNENSLLSICNGVKLILLRLIVHLLKKLLFKAEKVVCCTHKDLI